MADSSFISNIYTKITAVFVDNVSKYSESIASAAKPAFAAAISLYMVYIIYRMYSKKDALFEEFVDKLLLFAIVGAFTFGGDLYHSVINFVLNAGDELAGKLSSSSSSSMTAVDNVYNAFQQGIDMIKEKWENQSWWDSFSGESFNLILSLIFLYIAQFLFSILIAVNLLIAKVMVVLLLSVGIVFIAFAVFPATRNMFWSFLGLCFNYIFLNVLYSVSAKLSSDYIIGMLGSSNGAVDAVANAAQVLLASLILILAINQIPVLVSSLTGGVGISAFTISSHSFGKMFNLSRQSLFGKSNTPKESKGLIGGALHAPKAAHTAWKNFRSGSAGSAK